MKKENQRNNRSVHVTINCTKDEYEIIRQQARETTCRSLSEYARKKIFKKPVVVKTRNVSLDALIESVNGVRQQLDKLIGHQGLPPSERMQLMALSRELQLLFNQIADQCILK